MLRFIEALCWLATFLAIVSLKVLRVIADFIHVQLIRLLHLLERCALWFARMYKTTEIYVRMFCVRLVWMLVQLARLMIAFTPAIGTGIAYLFWQQTFLLWSAVGWTLLILIVGIVLSVKLRDQVDVYSPTQEDFSRMEHSIVAELIIMVFRCMPGILAFVFSWFVQGGILSGLCFWGGLAWIIAPLGLFLAFIENTVQSRAYARSGDSHCQKGNYDQAIADCTKAIEFDPQYAFSYRIRGDSHCQKGNYDQAIADFTKAIELTPCQSLYFELRAIAHEARGDTEKAASDRAEAQRLKGSS